MLQNDNILERPIHTKRERTDPKTDFYYGPQCSCGKVMFSQASVVLFTGGCGVWQTHPLGRHPPADIP